MIWQVSRMNNFITNIKNHKFIALGCLGVLLVLIVIVIIVSVNNNGTSDAPEKSAASEQTVYFEDTDHPVYISFVDNNVLVRINSVNPDDLKWWVFVLPGEIPLAENITEMENDLYLELSPTQEGYNTVCFVKEKNVAGITCEIVRIELDLFAAEANNGELKMNFSDIRQSNSEAGATDSDTPFILDGDRVLFPSGGDWVLSAEAGTPEGLYAFTEDKDEKGITYIRVMKNTNVLMDDETSNTVIQASYKLILSSESLGIEKRLNCRMSENRSWVLSVVEENDGEEN